MTKNTCPECNGTGVYQGLNTVESCRACGGKIGKSVIEYALMQEGFPWPIVTPKTSDFYCRVFDANGLEYQDVVSINLQTGEILQHARDANGSIIIENDEAKTESTKIPIPIRLEKTGPRYKTVGKSVIEYAAECAGIEIPALTQRDMFHLEWNEQHVTATYLPEPEKPFDEICPAEWEGIGAGRDVKVEVCCLDGCSFMRPFEAIDRLIDRPLFGFPRKAFILTNVSVQNHIEYIGTLRLLRIYGFADRIPSIGPYHTDPCQDMLFIPILED